MNVPTPKSIAREQLKVWRKVRRVRAATRLLRQAFLFNWFKAKKGVPFKNHQAAWNNAHKIAKQKNREIKELNETITRGVL
jgi:hypothetical protein